MDRIGEIRAHPGYRALVRTRRRLAWTLSAVMLAAYFGYILLIAFDPQWLATPIGGGVTTIGIPIGLGLILLGIALTALYVRRANRDFDARLEAILKDAAE
ncbi:MAG: DUF485 domain-containing protein [Sphingosinicella sp.]|uniref:DUF485 domain-containing protein n=1 Tax=Sphingosinicella sp. TaxID=1917971 RepID=UPI0040376460